MLILFLTLQINDQSLGSFLHYKSPSLLSSFFLLYFKMTFPKCFLIKLVSINMYKLKFLRVQHSCYFMTRRLKEWGPIASRIKVCVFIDAKPTRANKTLTKHLLPDILFIVQAIPRRRSDSFRAIFSKWNGTTTA